MLNVKEIKRWLMLLLMLTLAAGCAQNSQQLVPVPAPPQKIPPLSTEARQPDPPSICSTTCSEGLMKLRIQLLNLLTDPTSQAPLAKDPTTE